MQKGKEVCIYKGVRGTRSGGWLPGFGPSSFLVLIVVLLWQISSLLCESSLYLQNRPNSSAYFIWLLWEIKWTNTCKGLRACHVVNSRHKLEIVFINLFSWLNSKMNVSWDFLVRRAISDIRASICSENGTVTLAASSASLCLTSPGKMPRALSELVLPSRPQASWPPDLSQERKDFHSLPACPLSPCSGHPLSLAFCPSRFLFPEHLSPAHSCFFLISSLCLEYFFLPESSWQRPACPLKLTSCLWHSLTLRVSLCSWRTLHHTPFWDEWWWQRQWWRWRWRWQ